LTTGVLNTNLIKEHENAKDFHFDVIYVLARYAEFSHDDAFKIAYSSSCSLIFL